MLPRGLLGAAVTTGDVVLPDPVPADAWARGGDRLRIVTTRDLTHLHLVGAGRVRIDEAGRRVTVESDVGGDPSLLKVWMYGVVAAFVGAQQGRFALHASAVAVGDRVVAVAGDVGAGKSTTSLGLVGRGARLVADDVTMLEFGPAGEVLVEPFGRPVHLWPETADALGIDVSEAVRAAPDTEKLALPAPAAVPTALDAVVVLGRSEGVQAVEATPLVGADAVYALAANVSRRSLLVDLWHDELFAWATAVADRLPVYRVLRPSEAWSLDAVLDQVEQLAVAEGVASRSR